MQILYKSEDDKYALKNNEPAINQVESRLYT